MDRINIRGLHAYAYHGVHDVEKENGQNFYINATLYTDTEKSSVSDDLKDTVSYSVTAKLIYSIFTETSYDLIETAAERCAEAVLLGFPGVKKIDLEVRKPDAPIGLDFEYVSVDITRGWHKAYIAVGSNMGDRQEYIRQAVLALKNDKHIRFIRSSKIIETEPYGGVEQDSFLNGVFEIDTIYSPETLLTKLQAIEYDNCRERTIHWGPRTLDLDILLYDDYIINSEKLTVPHADMVNRQFVLEPMCEIAPHVLHPVLHISMSELFKRFSEKQAI